MLETFDIYNGNLIYDNDANTFWSIDNVGNARAKGDRKNATTPDDELSYSVRNILTNTVINGICEYSVMTSDTFRPATSTEVDIFLAKHEGEAMVEFGHSKQHLADVQQAILKFEKTK